MAPTFLSLLSGPAGAANPGANGLMVYASFVSSTPGSQIFAVDPAGGAPVDLSGANYGDDEPAVSPDGTRIAFRHNGSIWIMNIDDTGRHQIGGQGSEGNPSWSPDGTHLAFSTDARPDGFSYGGPNIWTMKDDGTERTQLTNDASSDQPAWAPDGSKIAYTSSDLADRGSSSTTSSTIAPSTTTTSAPSTTTTSTPATPICASLQQQLQTVGDPFAHARVEALLLGFGCRHADGRTTTTTAQPTTW